MDFSYNYRLINSNNIPSAKYRPYLLSDKENISNNLNQIYLSSESNIQKSKREIYPYNDVKKSLNLEISSYNNNSVDITKEKGQKLNRYSSYSSYTTTINKNLGINSSNKKTLILDLDETLVHSAFAPFSRRSDLTLTINFDGEDRLLYVLKRPFVDEFLNELSPFFEIIIFTASISEYANPLLDLLDKKKCIKQRLFREHCTFDNGIYIKDLKIFDRKINNMIIIDNNPLSYDNNVENGIPILSWYEDTNDKELLKLIPILKYMSNNDVIDVRNIINKIVDRNTNEINYNAINEVLNSKKVEKNNYNKGNNNYLLTKTDYRKHNKSVESRIKIINENNFKKEEEKYNNNNLTKNKIFALKNNFANKYENGSLKINVLNSKYNIHNIYNYNFDQKSNINIDKKDPYGIRKSIFSPEEYNTSYKHNSNNDYKGYQFPFKRNMYYINSFEEGKNNHISRTINPQQKNNYQFERYNNYSLSNQNQAESRLSTSKEEKKLNKNINPMNETSIKIMRTHSLVELTKKALHLNEKKEENKNNVNDSVPKTVERSKYFNDETRIIYNNYVNKIKYISGYKSDKLLFRNNDEQKYFRNYIQEYKNNDKIDNLKKFKSHSQIISLKQINSNNKKDNKKISSNNFVNNEKDRILERINNEKINNILGRNYFNEGKNHEKKIIPNYSQIDKDYYINISKKSYDIKKTNSVGKIFDNSNINYPKSTNNVKSFNNKRYDLLFEYKNKDVKNIISENKNLSSLNNKVNSLINLKRMNTNKNKSYNFNNLIGNSNYTKSGNSLNKSLSNLIIINNSNKENEKNSININNKYVKNLNYGYDII